MPHRDAGTVGVEAGQPRPRTVYALVGALVFQALSAFAGGLVLVADPSGAAMGLSVDALRGSPFDDYLVPGLLLSTVLGIGPAVAAHGLWKRRPWSRNAALVVGVALLVWIGVEIWIVGYHPQPPLQLVFGVVGVIIVLLARSTANKVKQ